VTILLIFFMSLFIGFLLGDVFSQWLIAKRFNIKFDGNISWNKIFSHLRRIR
jgi:hypothetical protein